MDKGVLERVEQALKVVYSSNTPAEERKAAEAFCEQLKREERASDYGHYLAIRTNGYAAEVRHFGVQLIEETLQKRWTTGGGRGNKKKATGLAKLTAEECYKIRDQIWELLVSGGSGEAAFVREKVVAVMVMLVIRLWPSAEWTNFSSQLQQLSASGEWETVQRVWQRLGEEVFVYERDAAAQVRKHELTNGLVGALLPLQVVNELYPNGMRLSTATTPAEGGGKKKAGLIVVEAGNEDGWMQRWLQEAEALLASDDSGERLLQVTRTLAAYVDWLPLRAMAALGLVPRVARLLHAHNTVIRQQAAEILERIAQRSVGSGEADAVLQQFSEHHNGAALTAIAQAYGSTVGEHAETAWDDMEDALNVARTLAQTCARLATQHWVRIAAILSRDSQAPLVELLSALARDNRHSVAAPALAAWATIARNAVLRVTPAVTTALSSVAEQTTAALVATSRTAQRLSAGSTVETAGFDAAEAEQLSAAEARVLLGEARTRQLGVLRALGEADPAGFVAWLAPALHEALSQPDAAAVDAALAATAAVLGSLDEAEQRALRDGDSATAEQLGHARVTCYALGRRVAEFDGGAETAMRQLQTLPSLAFLLRPAAVESQIEARELLVAIVRRCVVAVRSPGLLARRATAALVRVAVAVPDSLMLAYSDVAQLVQELLDDASVPGAAKGALREFQLAVVAGAEGCSLARRAELALPLLRPLVDALYAVVPSLESPTAFLTLLWRPPGHADAAADAHARGRRDELTRALATLLACLGRTLGDGATHLAPLWGELANELVPQLQQLIRCLHALWNPVHWSGMPHDVQTALSGMLEMSDTERHAIVGVADEQSSASVSRDPLFAEAHAVRHLLGILREHAYSCLGRLARLPSAPIEPAIVLADLEHVAPRHWRTLLTNVATPVLASLGNWPGVSTRDFVGATAEAWLVPLAVVCMQRLDSEWQSLEQSTSLSEDSQLAVTEEIIRERAVRMWTRAWSRLICELLEGCVVSDAARLESELTSTKVRTPTVGDVSVSGNVVHGNPVLGAHLLGSDLFVDVLGAALGVLRYPDTAAARLVLLRLAELAPSLTIIALLPLHCPPTPALASIVNGLLERIKCARLIKEGECSPLFGWLATEFVPALLRVLASPRLVDCQDITLGVLADVFYASAIFSRISTHWPRRYSSGEANVSQQIVGDPGHVFRQMSLNAMAPALHSVEISTDDSEHAFESVATISESRRRRALLKMSLMPFLAVEQARQFDNPKNHLTRGGDFEETEITRAAPAHWTNKLAAGATASILDNDSEFDLAALMP
ncbi:karyopherin [Coemansia sp. RSA 1365]|nr:karyopherin [Coemansia sp. RSA 1365]